MHSAIQPPASPYLDSRNIGWKSFKLHRNFEKTVDAEDRGLFPWWVQPSPASLSHCGRQDVPHGSETGLASSFDGLFRSCVLLSSSPCKTWGALCPALALKYLRHIAYESSKVENRQGGNWEHFRRMLWASVCMCNCTMERLRTSRSFCGKWCGSLLLVRLRPT